MKATALVVSARQYGNSYEFAKFVLEHSRSIGYETELINFYNYHIYPCNGCNYECETFGEYPSTPQNYCPIDDDIPKIWEKVWETDILFLFIPTYRGFPPARWFAFLQRGLGYKMPSDLWSTLQERKRHVVASAVVLASPNGATGGEWTPSIVLSFMRSMNFKIAAFEVINHFGFDVNVITGRLTSIDEVKRRLEYLVQRTNLVVNQK